MSYTAGKYGDGYVYPEVPLNVSVSDEVRTMLEVYTEGVRDADAMLGELVSYFSRRQEPVILVFYGDHLPYLGDNQQGYAELGLTQSADWADLTSYETPYVIWANPSAASLLPSREDLPETISAAFLGAAVLDITGRGQADSWFAFLNQLRREVPVVQKQSCLLPDGTLTQTPGDALQAEISKWRQWSYYNLKYKDVT